MPTDPEPIRILVTGTADSITRKIIERAAARISATIELIYADAAKHADGDIVITGTSPNLLIIDDHRSLEVELFANEEFTLKIEWLEFDTGFQCDLPPFKPTCYAPKGKQTKAKKSYTCTGRVRGNYY